MRPIGIMIVSFETYKYADRNPLNVSSCFDSLKVTRWSGPNLDDHFSNAAKVSHQISSFLLFSPTLLHFRTFRCNFFSVKMTFHIKPCITCQRRYMQISNFSEFRTIVSIWNKLKFYTGHFIITIRSKVIWCYLSDKGRSWSRNLNPPT